jgi:hypothetical protein
MKIHLLPPLPPVPPAAPQKAPLTALEVEQMAEALIETAQQQRLHRIRRTNAPRDQRSSGADGNEPASYQKGDTVDVLV